MRSETAIFWYGKRNLIELATKKAEGKIGDVFHGFVEHSNNGDAPIVHLFGSRGDIIVQLEWSDGLHNIYDDWMIQNI